MTIRLIEIKYEDKYAYKYLPFEYCCWEMEHYKGTIGLNRCSIDKTDYFNYPMLGLHAKQANLEEVFIQLRYCPFCGEEIKTEFVKKVDETEKYRKIRKEYHEITNELRTARKTLDPIADRLYKLGEELDGYRRILKCKEKEK